MEPNRSKFFLHHIYLFRVGFHQFILLKEEDKKNFSFWTGGAKNLIKYVLKFFPLFIVTFFLFINYSFANLKTDFYRWPTPERFERAAEASYKMKQFQIPFYAGLASLLLFDGNLSESIGDQNYLFGSSKNAGHVSDGLLISLVPMMIYTSTLTNISTETSQSDLGQRSKLVGFQGLLVLTDFLIIGVAKNAFQRVRPDESDNLSFPSGHSSVSSGLSRMVYNNIENSDLADTSLGYTYQATAIMMSSLVAYARVEAKKHHLSDIFLGNAFGAYISDFLYNSFLERRVDIIPVFSVQKDSHSLNLAYRF